MKNEMIKVIAQHFYGNCTGTTIGKENLGLFLRGWIDTELVPDSEKDYELKTVMLPNAENIVVVYDEKQEKEYIENDLPKIKNSFEVDGRKDFEAIRKTKLMSCYIPEIDFTIYTRCIACRVDETGEFVSLEAGDSDKVIKYFTA